MHKAPGPRTRLEAPAPLCYQTPNVCAEPHPWCRAEAGRPSRNGRSHDGSYFLSYPILRRNSPPPRISHMTAGV